MARTKKGKANLSPSNCKLHTKYHGLTNVSLVVPLNLTKHCKPNFVDLTAGWTLTQINTLLKLSLPQATKTNSSKEFSQMC